MDVLIWLILELLFASWWSRDLRRPQAGIRPRLEPPPRWGRLAVQARGAACPYCKTPIRDAPTVCGRCRTPHHADCFREFGRCSVYACNGRAAESVARAGARG